MPGQSVTDGPHSKRPAQRGTAPRLDRRGAEGAGRGGGVGLGWEVEVGVGCKGAACHFWRFGGGGIGDAARDCGEVGLARAEGAATLAVG